MAHWSSLWQARLPWSRQTGVPRSFTASLRPARVGSFASIRAKNFGITARGWQALGRFAVGSGAGVPSPPQSRPANGLPPAFMSLHCCVEQAAPAIRPRAAPAPRTKSLADQDRELFCFRAGATGRGGRISMAGGYPRGFALRNRTGDVAVCYGAARMETRLGAGSAVAAYGAPLIGLPVD